MLTDGQKDAAAMSYAPLPKEVVAKEMKQIAMIQVAWLACRQPLRDAAP